MSWYTSLENSKYHYMKGDSIGKFIRWTVNTEHTVVITWIREETLEDEVIQTLAKRIVIKKGD